MAGTNNQNQRIISWTDLSGPATHVSHRAVDSNRKSGSPRLTVYEAHSVALQTKLEGSRITREGDTISQVTPSPPKMMAGGRQCAPRKTITPTKKCSAIVYRRIKRRLGHSLKQNTARGTWSLPESKLDINYLELKAVFLALKEFQDLCQNNIVHIAIDNTTVVAYINKEGGMKSGPLCTFCGES